jgi:hypothetical protein
LLISFTKVCFGILFSTIHSILAIEVYRKHEPKIGKTVKEWNQFSSINEEFRNELKSIAREVEEFTAKFEIPGNDEY